MTKKKKKKVVCLSELCLKMKGVDRFVKLYFGIRFQKP